MKIGILTFHNTTNYGAILQAYALQKHIIDIGQNCEVINYCNSFLLSQYDINPFHSKNIKQFIKKILRYSKNRRKRKLFEEFSKKYIYISSKKYNEGNISDADELYDIFIAGSDQIWNLSLSGNDENYFMIFSKDPKKRNSYAASIGKNKIDEITKRKIKILISKQNNISLREKQGKEIIQKLTEKNIDTHIDPTFLVSKKDWEIIKSDKKPNYKYIFVYEVSCTKNLRKFAEFLANKTGLKIIFISGTSKNIKNAKKISDASPEEFLSYIYNAEYIITSSFHGMALSIIFNKEFYYDTFDDKNSLGSRLENLAELLNLKSRKIISEYEKNNTEKINYEQVNQLIEKEIKRSIIYIKKIISLEKEIHNE